ncbi:MAG: metallophosphoesterase [Desulfatibacillaceae bacterium]|nr:metallophosphoesterase [Desulfatibacillaceae bacterium]
MTRLYAVADIHAGNRAFDTIRSVIMEHRPDALVVAGDMAGRSPWGKKSVIGRLCALPIPVFAVRGNSDSKDMERIIHRSSNIKSLHLSSIEFGRAKLVGVSGTLALPFASRIALGQKELFRALENMVGPDTILVAHPPPRGSRDRVLGRFSAGCGALAELVKKNQPLLVLCGHIHENTGTAFMGKTLVVNCALGHGCKGALVDIDPNLTVRML